MAGTFLASMSFDGYSVAVHAAYREMLLHKEILLLYIVLHNVHVLSNIPWCSDCYSAVDPQPEVHFNNTYKA